jgi:hypothetical protein
LRDEFSGAQVNGFGSDATMIEGAKEHFLIQLLIGAHGAGLSNIMFVPDGATVIEIHPDISNGGAPPHMINGCHKNTAGATGAKSVQIVADNGRYDEVFTALVDEIIEAAKKVVPANMQKADTTTVST